jgi:hypothetical protein
MCTFVSCLFINNSKTYYGCQKKLQNFEFAAFFKKKTMANYHIKEVG